MSLPAPTGATPFEALTAKQQEILTAIAGYEFETGEPCPAAYLCRRAGRHHATIQSHLTRLHAHGWLSTSSSPSRLRSHHGLGDSSAGKTNRSSSVLGREERRRAAFARLDTFSTALDGSDTSNKAAQLAIFKTLRGIGLTAPQQRDLVQRLEGVRGLAELVREQRIQRQETLWRLQRRAYDAILDLHTELEHRAERQGLHIDSALANDVMNVLERLSLPGRQLEDGPSLDAVVARRRNVTDKVSIRRGAPIRAVQQRFMPKIRRVVWKEIYLALINRAAPFKRGGRVLKDEAAADYLTAEFIRAFFPSWGQTTTAELVRKARAGPSR